MTEELKTAGDYVVQRLQSVPSVHSLKVRVKNPEHLVGKIIRKKIKTPSLQFDCASYDTLVTDLIGIRALHLFKDDWREIHKFITDTWDLHEEPLAYVREGDPSALTLSFKDAGCKVEEHPFGYRSIHYVLKTKPARSVRLVEVQVRTIFEEGWSEIDHRVRYPRQSDNSYLATFLTIFNRLAGAADEMGTYTTVLCNYIRAHSEHVAASEKRIGEIEERLKKAVSELRISNEDKANLQKQISELRHRPDPFMVGTSIMPKFTALLGNSVSPGWASPAWPLGISTKTCSTCGSIFTEAGIPSVTDRCPECIRRFVVRLSDTKL